jgi:hypothetical protein
MFRRTVFLSLILLNLNLFPQCSQIDDCKIGEICVSYTGCDRKQVRVCLSQDCYRNGIGCPKEIYCYNKHCANWHCPAK